MLKLANRSTKICIYLVGIDNEISIMKDKPSENHELRKGIIRGFPKNIAKEDSYEIEINVIITFSITRIGLQFVVRVFISLGR